MLGFFYFQVSLDSFPKYGKGIYENEFFIEEVEFIVKGGEILFIKEFQLYELDSFIEKMMINIST